MRILFGMALGCILGYLLARAGFDYKSLQFSNAKDAVEDAVVEERVEVETKSLNERLAEAERIIQILKEQMGEKYPGQSP